VSELAGAGLSLLERGRALAAVRLLGPIAAAARLRSPAAHIYLEQLADPQVRAREEEALAALVPAHLERVDRSWYEPPADTRSEPARRYLARVAFGALVSMEPRDVTATRRTAVERLIEGPVERLLEALLLLGRRRVAVAFTGAPRSALAQLLARLGEPEASRLAAEVRAIPPGVSAEEVKAAQRALFRSDATMKAEDGALFFQRIGAGWLAPLIAGQGDRARRAAQRLPRVLGELLLREHEPTVAEGERAALQRLCAQLL